MKTFQKWVLVLGMAFNLACQGQVGRPNAGPTLTISGTVFDPSGAPAPGVIMMMAGTVGGGPNGQVKTDHDGKYTLDWQTRNGQFAGAAQSPAYALIARDMEHNFAASHLVEETNTQLDLHLQPALTLSVKVQDQDGKPIANAAGSLNIRSGNVGIPINRPPLPAVVADDQGLLQFKTLPQGFFYRVFVNAPGYGAANMNSVQPEETQTTHLDLPPIVLKRANLKLAGQVLGADGKPAAGASVFVSGLGQPTTNLQSDANGRFVAMVCDGNVNVSANVQGANGNTQTTGGDTNVVVKLGVNNNGIVNAVQPPNRVTLTGTVFDPSGAPAAGVTMSVTPGGGGNQDLKSDAGGKFTLTWQPIFFGGNVNGNLPTITYLLLGRDLQRNYAGSAGIDEKTKNMDLHLQTGLIMSGTVVDNNDAPVKSATVRLLITTGQMSSVLNQMGDAVDGQGAFTLNGLMQGRAYNLNVTAPGYGQASLPVRENQTQTALLQLPPIKLQIADQRLEGQVVGPDDKPVAGAIVRVNGVGQPQTTATSDARGHFALKVCEGMVRLIANVPQTAQMMNANGVRQMLNGNIQAQSGDLNVVLKLGQRQVMQAGNGVVQIQQRRSPLRPQAWTWTAVYNWPQEHRPVVIIALSLQLTALLGTAAGILWLTRARRS